VGDEQSATKTETETETATETATATATATATETETETETATEGPEGGRRLRRGGRYGPALPAERDCGTCSCRRATVGVQLQACNCTCRGLHRPYCRGAYERHGVGETRMETRRRRDMHKDTWIERHGWRHEKRHGRRHGRGGGGGGASRSNAQPRCGRVGMVYEHDLPGARRSRTVQSRTYKVSNLPEPDLQGLEPSRAGPTRSRTFQSRTYKISNLPEPDLGDQSA
jgi:hypothetical protein